MTAHQEELDARRDDNDDSERWTVETGETGTPRGEHEPGVPPHSFVCLER